MQRADSSEVSDPEPRKAGRYHSEEAQDLNFGTEGLDMVVTYHCAHHWAAVDVGPEEEQVKCTGLRSHTKASGLPEADPPQTSPSQDQLLGESTP
ncbi:hypothetical protein NDU88_004107 [Pleurodeles waltl]|uniref:Uncharacterized protein n=1 Tax=Pleurodeles waltl TaxID=8319 RepID=A0AAV7KXE9_PLEWA|nr:hypothetical protein NDU88_004107 [Pleurodeles waltl]